MPSTDVAVDDRVTDLADALEFFLTERARLFRLAYRVVRDVAAAEDVVQEAWLRWQRTDRGAIDNPAAFLTTTTTRLAINVVQSAWNRHEAPTESPFDELADPAEDPAFGAELGELAEVTLQLLMASLTSTELAAYVLRKGFDYPYEAVAGLIGTSVPNARQLVRRAQLHLQTGTRRAVPAGGHRLLVSAFTVAARSGELEMLERLLAPEQRAA